MFVAVGMGRSSRRLVVPGFSCYVVLASGVKSCRRRMLRARSPVSANSHILNASSATARGSDTSCGWQTFSLAR